MKRLIRKIINWAYGRNILLELVILEEAKRNLAIIVQDLALRSHIKNPPKREDEL